MRILLNRPIKPPTAFGKFSEMMPVKLSLKPSEYVRRQVWATFQDDPIGPKTYESFGANNYMWASDFPHTDSTFPESHAWIANGTSPAFPTRCVGGSSTRTASTSTECSSGRSCSAPA